MQTRMGMHTQRKKDSKKEMSTQERGKWKHIHIKLSTYLCTRPKREVPICMYKKDIQKWRHIHMHTCSYHFISLHTQGAMHNYMHQERQAHV